jgi:NADH-quinone oxidoreductase subunit L
MLFGRLTGHRAHWIAVPALLGSFVVSCVVAAHVFAGHPFTTTLGPWIVAGEFDAGITAYVDQLTAVMLLVVTGVGFLIHLYSAGYMHDDPSYARYFAYLNLFVFSMTMLVLGGNFLLLFLGWEAVGLCSYLLIGFWYTRDAAARAGKKAFIVNRVGDLGFLLGLMWLWTALGSVEFSAVFKGAETLPPATATGIALLLFMGACGKSAQIPLHTWLPDAMEGPTPVSALIHAATMVTAGVYMVARSHVIFERSGGALEVVAWVGTATAVFAATIGLVQTDIKRVLAYSTVSQLGYMFAAVGVGAYVAGIFHLVTHAFFKALLFLGAGSVIHGLHGEQDLRKMGGLASKMPVTATTMWIGGLGLAGCPLLAGFFSKDEILGAAYGSGHSAIFALLVAGAFMTAFYTFRLLFLAFSGGSRMSKDAFHHAHESPWVMTGPLVVLAALTIVAGFVLGLPTDRTRLAQLLGHVFHPHEGAHAIIVLVLSVIVFGAGGVLAFYMYRMTPVRAEDIGRPRSFVHRFLLNAWYVDALYDRVIVRPIYAMAVALASAFDQGFIDGIVNGLGRAVSAWGAGLRRLQSGYVANYALTMLAGAVIVVAFFLAR